MQGLKASRTLQASRPQRLQPSSSSFSDSEHSPSISLYHAQTPRASSSSSSSFILVPGPPESNAHCHCHCHCHCCSSSPRPPRRPSCPRICPWTENSRLESSFLNPRPRPPSPSCPPCFLDFYLDPFLPFSISSSHPHPPPLFARCRNSHKLNRRRSQLDSLIIKQSQKTSTATNSNP
jgi:hypothetical protein